MTGHPTGTVTFLFTDIEGSTQLWEQHPEAMQLALARHDALLRQAIQVHHGYVFKTVGDAFCAAFGEAGDALNAALAAQRGLQAAGGGLPLKVRMALHTGAAEERDSDYFGPPVNRVARLMAAGHGGQILLSLAAHERVQAGLPAAASLRDLGERRLKDLIRPERIYQVVVPDLPGDFAPLKTLETFRTNLPVQLTSFVGREAEMAEIKTLLSGNRLTTLAGPGGTGKTRLSLQVAADLLDGFADGLWLVELAPLNDPDLILPALAATFDLREQSGRSLPDIITDYLRAKHLLLILDNCEHLIEACARLANDLLHACPYLKILASSREALGVAGEAAYRVPPLSLPQAGDVLHSEAARLFVERAVAAQPRFAVNDKNAPVVAQICRRLDGIPLALELAAARVKLFSVEQIAARLDDRFRLLVGGSRVALPRQQTLQALIDWSYDLLSEPERRMLRQLSVFVGGWTFEAAEAVGGGTEALELLTQLVNKSLVRVDEGDREVRYHLLETIRQYARDKLFEAREAESARDRHFAHFRSVIRDAQPGLRGPAMLEWIAKLGPEFDNFCAALDWAQEHDAEGAVDLAEGLSWLWFLQGRVTDVALWLDAALERVAALPPEAGEAALRRQRLQARGIMATGQMLYSRGDLPGTVARMRTAVALARTAQDDQTLAFALALLANGLEATGDPEAMALAGESIVLCKKLGDDWALSLAVSVVARAEGRLGDETGARAHMSESLRLARASGNLWVLSISLLGFGLVARYRGEVDAARERLSESQALFHRQGNRILENGARSELAHLARQTGNLSEAKAAYHQTLRVFQDVGHRPAVANQLECLAFIARAEAQAERAARLLGAAEALREQINSPMTGYESREYAQETAALRAAGAEAVNAAWAQGRGLNMEQAIELALEP